MQNNATKATNPDSTFGAFEWISSENTNQIDECSKLLYHIFLPANPIYNHNSYRKLPNLSLLNLECI